MGKVQQMLIFKFLGEDAGYQATNATQSNFFGSASGYRATGANSSNFLGLNAVYSVLQQVLTIQISFKMLVKCNKC
jgi:hypothetical protein